METTTIARSAGVLEHIDPNDIVIEANVRPSAPLTPEFIESIRDHGVIVPTYGYRDEGGRVIVRAGQRRTLGAREAGIATMPIYVVHGDESTVTRIIEQLIENEQRENLTEVERAAAWQQLAFEGLSVAKIARRTGTKATRIKTGLAVLASETATAAAAEHQMNLEQAAALIEFEGDEEATSRLIEVATTRPDQFDHEAQRQRDQRKIREAIATLQAEVASSGIPLRAHRPDWDAKCVPTSNLATVDGKDITVEDLIGKEGVTAHVGSDWRGVNVTYYVDNPAALGFKRRGANGEARTPMTDAEKAERRELIENNRAWDSANAVRIAWLTEFVNRKNLPKDASRFVAEGLTRYTFALSRSLQENNPLAHELLGVERPERYYGESLTAHLETHPTKAANISLAIVLGGIEASLSRETWRHPRETSMIYFSRLADWGYALSDVEQLVIDRYIAQSTAEG